MITLKKESESIMKKFAVLILILALICSLCACYSSPKIPEGQVEDAIASATTPPVPAEGNKIIYLLKEQRVENYFPDGTTAVTRSEYAYDSNWHLFTLGKYTQDGLDEQRTAVCDEQGVVQKLYINEDNYTLFEYDDHYRVIKMSEYENGNLVTTSETVYNEEGHAIRTVETNHQKGTVQRVEISLNDMGQQTGFREYSNDNLVGTIVYTLNDNGDIKEVFVYDNNGTLNNRQELHYDQEKNVVRTVCYDIKDKVIATITVVSDAAGNVILRKQIAQDQATYTAFYSYYPVEVPAEAPDREY